MKLASTTKARMAFIALFVFTVLALNILIISDMAHSSVKSPGLPDYAIGARDMRPLVALLVPVSWGSIASRNVSSVPLFSKTFPSLIAGLNCEYRYMVVIGYRNDDYFGTLQGAAELDHWFEALVRSPTKERNMEVALEVVAVSSSPSRAQRGVHMATHWASCLRATARLYMGLTATPCCHEDGVGPEPMVTELARRAYERGADFFFRMKEDTELRGRFAKPLAAALVNSQTRGRYFGVSGPCSLRQGSSNRVLEHHFVHRSHLEAFSMHFYPRGLQESEEDLWISRVYGPQHTFIARHIGAVSHLQLSSKSVSSSARESVASRVNRSREELIQWLDSGRSNSMGTGMIGGGESKRSSDKTSNSMTVLNAKPQHLHLALECDKGTSIGSPSSRFQWCFALKRLHDLELPGDFTARASRISPADRAQWRESNCSEVVMDPTLKSTVFSNAGPVKSSKPTRELKLHLRAPLASCDNSSSSAALPLIAVMAATTSRNVPKPNVTTVSLFKTMLPSLLYSLDCGFRYVVVLGVDETDDFYGSPRGAAMVSSWFETHMGGVMREREMEILLRVVTVANPLLKPGPVFLRMAREAFALGAEFMYRVNDDTEFIERWPRVFTQALLHLPPPYGVIGPRAFNTDNRILTHDFVHRTHMEIFDLNYYPPELSDWWMDDWVSSVYGPRRSFMAKHITIYHHIKAHGKRYKVDFEHEKSLPALVTTGRQRVADWMRAHGGSEEEFQTFLSDTRSPSTSQDVKLQYFSQGRVESYYEIVCKNGKNDTFCPADSVVVKKRRRRVPVSLSSP